jgi:hypothetical protein
LSCLAGTGITNYDENLMLHGILGKVTFRE